MDKKSLEYRRVVGIVAVCSQHHFELAKTVNVLNSRVLVQSTAAIGHNVTKTTLK